MTTIEKGMQIRHNTENLTATIIAVAHVKQNACIQYEDGYFEIRDFDDLKSNFSKI